MSIKQRLLAGVVATLISVAAGAVTPQDQEIIDRIKPVGEVCIEGKSDCAPPPSATPAAPRSGEQVFTTVCTACHQAGIAGAPKLGDTADWAPRIAQGEDTLLSHALAGFTGTKGSMPPKGTCMNCSDAEIRAAVQYMADKSK